MNCKSFWMFLIMFSVIAEEHSETLLKPNNFYRDFFIATVLNVEKQLLEQRKQDLLARTPGYNNQENGELNTFQLIVRKDIEDKLNQRLMLLQQVAENIKVLLQKNYGITQYQILWSQTLLKQACERVAEESNFFKVVNNCKNEKIPKNLSQELTQAIVAEFACAYGKEAGCKGMGWRRFLFGESVAYYLRGGQERDPFERVD